MPDKIAIKVRNVKKDFYLPHHKSNSIKQSIVQVFQSKEKGGENFHALRGVSFDVKDGEFLGIVGRNGSGKSTLLKILSNIYAPTSGHVKHHGKLVPFIELGVGFKAELTGRENVYLNGALLGFSKKEIDERYDAIVAFSELADFMDQKLKNYSSGMKVRLAFSVATHADADILLLDEVLAVGDADFQRKCYDYFKSLKKQKKTIIFVTHSMGAVREYCDRAILIKDGKVACEGLPDEVADEYLKMFNKTESSVGDTKGRWGSKEAQFIGDITAKVSEKTVTVRCTIENGEQPLSDVIVAIDIYDDKNKLVGGIDVNVQWKNAFDLQPREEKKMQFTFENIFGGGNYSATVALKSRGGEYIYDFWRKAVTFANVTKVDDYFPVVLPVEIRQD